MARRRFYAQPSDIDGSAITLSTDETHHLMHVLRITPGDEAFVFDGCGREYRCLFRSVESNRARLEIADSLSDVVESPLSLTLAQALSKGEKFDFIIQKATELGVSRVAPLATRYADVKLDEQQVTRRLERWRRISLEALKQCGRRKLVEITAPRTLREFLDSETHAANDSAAHAASDSETHAASLHSEGGAEAVRKLAACATLLVLNKRGGIAINEALAEISNPSSIVAMVGPEGGWSDDELALLSECGCRSVSLGPRVLRTETAAVVAITLIQHALGDVSK